MNTQRVNIIKPLLEKILPLLDDKFPNRFRRRLLRPRPTAIQLEFPGLLKK